MKLHHYIPMLGLAIANLWSVEILQARQSDLYEDFEQTPDTINQTDANGKRQGWWMLWNDESPSKKGEFRQEGKYIDGKKTGVWTRYFLPSYKKEYQITFINWIAKWPAKFYYKDGTLQEEGIRNGTLQVRIGDYKYYHENSQLSYDWHYDESGKRQWIQTYYYENGNVMIVWKWINGQEDWLIEIFNEDGSRKQDKYLSAGKIDVQKTKNYEPGQQYHPDANKKTTIVQTTNKETEQLGVFRGTGQYTLHDSKYKNNITKTGYFENGKLIDGKEFEYDEAGKLKKTYIYKGGKLLENTSGSNEVLQK